MLNLEKMIATKISPFLGISTSETEELLEIPPQIEMGDYALPCFKFAKQMRKSPAQIAADIAREITPEGLIREVEAAGPYVNFRLDYSELAKLVLEDIRDSGEQYGGAEDKNENIVIDYSSPNIAKPFHIGHLRSTVIGGALYNIYKHLGYNSIGINHLGDWGTQFGKQILAYQLWGNEEKVAADPINELVKLYVKFHEEAEMDPELEDRARESFARLEQGDSEMLRLWEKISHLSMVEFAHLYEVLGVKFDYNTGESFYRDKVGAIIEELEEKNLLKESEGALVVDLGEEIPPCLIQKADGTSIYTSRDIAAAFYRQREFAFSKALYVTDYSQALHFRQWIQVIKLMGYEWADYIHHVPFGRVRLTEGKMQTRKGNVILLKDVLSEAIDKTSAIIDERNPDLPDIAEVARQVAVGALIFNDLYNNRINDIVFNWDEILNFDGETGPYVQYTYARSCRVLERAEQSDKIPEYHLLTDDDSVNLIKSLYRFPKAVIEAADLFEPSFVSRELMAVARTFNRFYHNNQILSDDSELQTARLALCKAANNVLAIGMRLLNMPSPKRM